MSRPVVQQLIRSGQLPATKVSRRDGWKVSHQLLRPGSTRDMPTPGPGSCPTRPPLPACGTDALEAPPVNTRLLTGPTHGPGTSRLPAWAADRRPETGPPVQQWPHQPAEAMVDDPSEATSCGHQPPTGSARRRDPHRPQRRTCSGDGTVVTRLVEVSERGRDGLRGADVGDGALGPSTVGEQLQGDLVHSGRADVHRARDQPSSARWRATTRPIPRGDTHPVTTAARSCWRVVMSTLIGVSLMCPAGSGSWGGGCDAPCRAGLRSQLPSSPSAPGLPRWTAARRRSPKIPRRRVLRSR